MTPWPWRWPRRGLSPDRHLPAATRRFGTSDSFEEALDAGQSRRRDVVGSPEIYGPGWARRDVRRVGQPAGSGRLGVQQAMRTRVLHPGRCSFDTTTALTLGTDRRSTYPHMPATRRWYVRLGIHAVAPVTCPDSPPEAGTVESSMTSRGRVPVRPGRRRSNFLPTNLSGNRTAGDRHLWKVGVPVSPGAPRRRGKPATGEALRFR